MMAVSLYEIDKVSSFVKKKTCTNLIEFRQEHRFPGHSAKQQNWKENYLLLAKSFV
jgi:hypothetical protein